MGVPMPSQKADLKTQVHTYNEAVRLQRKLILQFQVLKDKTSVQAKNLHRRIMEKTEQVKKLKVGIPEHYFKKQQ